MLDISARQGIEWVNDIMWSHIKKPSFLTKALSGDIWSQLHTHTLRPSSLWKELVVRTDNVLRIVNHVGIVAGGICQNKRFVVDCKGRGAAPANCEILICRLVGAWLPDVVVVLYLPGMTFFTG